MNARRLARGWLLWLALILPIAQAMSGVHAFAHLADPTSERSGEHPRDSLLHHGHCGLCLGAAQLVGGAPPAPVLLLARPELRHAAPTLQHARWQPSGISWQPPARAPPRFA